MPALYRDTLENFLEINPEQLLGRLTAGLAREGFDTTTLTTFSWQSEISEFQAALLKLVCAMPEGASWQILLEYVLPVVGQRVDCVLLAHDVIYVIEYKGGTSASSRSALLQAQDYALNLADFHEASRGRIAIPVAAGAFKTGLAFDIAEPLRGAAISLEELSGTIVASYDLLGGSGVPIDAIVWDQSRYFPVPTIIQAATAIYQNHDVKELAHSRAGTENLELTQDAIADHVQDARQRGAKLLIMITGVPGAGKTLAGLNAVQVLAQHLDPESEQASFLSGNGPLVAVLNEALKRNIRSERRGAGRSVRSRIKDMHRFVRDSDSGTEPPADRLIVFDEAQRAWTAKKNLKKFGRDLSEPEIILRIMGRHKGWAVVVALVGGGQEIHGGEAGLAAWGDAIAKNPEWAVITSPEAVNGGPSVAGSRLFRVGAPAVDLITDSRLHLDVARRSYDSEVIAPWVNAVLDGRADEAAELASKGLPIYLTRDLSALRRWLQSNAGGTRRAGLIASSGAARLRAEGVEPPTFSFLRGIKYEQWFLEPSGDHRSSNQLEIALSEFEMQGLEIDYAGLCWGGDLTFPNGHAVARRLRGRKWATVRGVGDPQASADDLRTRIQNKYRVLLTRFRKSMAIFVPGGSSDDSTRDPAEFDGIAAYLERCEFGQSASSVAGTLMCSLIPAHEGPNMVLYRCSLRTMLPFRLGTLSQRLHTRGVIPHSHGQF